MRPSEMWSSRSRLESEGSREWSPGPGGVESKGGSGHGMGVFHVEHSQLKGKVVATREAYRRTKKYNSTRTLLTSAHVKVPIQNEGKLGPPCEPPP